MMSTVCPDFSELPEVVWVRIFSFLPLRDRACASETCHSLLDVFHHPSVWSNMFLPIFSFGQRYEIRNSLIMNAKCLETIKRFGKFFQSLHVTVNGYVNNFPKEYSNMFEDLSACRLKKLTLDIGYLLSKKDFFWQRPKRIDIDAILVLVTKSTKLKILNIVAWPFYPGLHSADIMKAIQQNDQLCNLESLNLFWTEGGRDNWTTLNAALPSREAVEETLGRLVNLRILKIRSALVTAKLLTQFTVSDCTPLEKLSVLVTYSRHDEMGALPEISSSIWSSLKHKSPRLKVDFTLATQIPFEELSVFLNTEIPLSAVTFMKYSECLPMTVSTFSDQYHRSLQKFEDLSEGCEEMDENLKIMVTKCQFLEHFHFGGPLLDSTVIELAKCRRKYWKSFVVNQDKVITTKHRKTGNEGCTIVQERSDGSVDTVTLPFGNQSVEEREVIIRKMVEELRIILNS